jgi:hypothetical protein
MNISKIRIDQSVYLSIQSNNGSSLKNWKNYFPLFSISAAEKLKSALVKRFSAEYEGVATRLLHQAVNEAYALVSRTPVPLLLLPVLAEEKVQNAAAWTARQQSMRRLDSLALAS